MRFLEDLNLPLWATFALIVLDFAVKAIALGLVPERRKPTSAMAWLILIFFVPGIGITIFLLIGSPFVNRRRREAQHQVGVVVQENIRYPAIKQIPSWPGWVSSTIVLNERLGWLDPVGGNTITIETDYQESISRMAAAIDAAEHHVHVEFYIVAWDDVTDPMFTAMVNAVRRGVAVRLLYDHLACIRTSGYAKMLKRLEGTGIEWHPMLPLQPLKRRWGRIDLRNHRKIVVVDGLVAFTGSQNLIHPSYHKPKHEKAGRRWKELMIRVEGPVAQSLLIVFATDWYIETGERLPEHYFALPDFDPQSGIVCQVVPSGPGFPDENNLRLFNTLIYGAERRLSITSPYFVPDESLLYAITTAAQRGVDVELFVSEEADQFMVDHAQKSYYTVMLEAGIRIFMYPAPAILHAKHMSVDDVAAVVGSSNMDIRSFNLDFEVSVLLLDAGFVSELRAVEDHYREISTELTLAAWRTRPLVKRYLDNVLRLTSALQ